MLDAAPRYWTCDKPRHEVDFLLQVEDVVVPVEVKSGAALRSPSLRYYTAKHADATPLRVRFSMRNLALDDGLLNIPLYMADRALPLMKQALSSL